MPKPIIEPGCSFQFTSRNKDDHLWFVISDCKRNADAIVIVNISTLRAYSDQSCVLDASDHDFISQKSCVRYDGAVVVSLPRLIMLAENGLIVEHERATPEVLYRILDGASVTRQIPLEVKRILQGQGLIN